jgi:Tol biopolymer transport system component
LTLASGARLGPYEIVSPLGAGGMGEVYRARDTRLGREVAIKVLPAEVAGDAERLRRFEQEAKAVSALNHPHIVTLHELGQSEHGPFLVLEKIEGRSLRELLRGGALPVKRVLALGAQIAEGLAKAHAAGIVHRDLKPENVMVSDDGFAKILDFGLAKLVFPELESGHAAEMTTLVDKTASGMILGTLGYLSPEQAAGRPADFRSDQFALGALLYELATGERPFRKETTPETLTAILREEPEPLRTMNAALPAQLGWIVDRCLAKDPNERYASTRDLARDLADLRDHLSEVVGRVVAEGSEPRLELRAGARLPWLLAATATLAAALVALFAWRGPVSRAAAADDVSFERVTQLPGAETQPTLSADGKSVVYVRDSDLWLQRVGGSKAINLTASPTIAEHAPAFSPDGSRIAFHVEDEALGGIFVMGATGENVRRVTTRGFQPAWTPDGRELVFTAAQSRIGYEGSLYPGLDAVDLGSGSVRRLCDCTAATPAVSPHGRRVAYWAHRRGGARRDLWTVPLAGLTPGESPVRLTDDDAYDWSPIWSPDGTALEFVSDRSGTPNLWRLPIDEASGRALGPPTPRLLASAFVAQVESSSDDRVRLFESQTRSSVLLRAELDPRTGELESAPIEALRWNDWIYGFDSRSFAPDGSRIVIQGGSSAAHETLVLSLDGSEVRRLSEGSHRKLAPRWSPDGKRIAFGADRAGVMAIWGISVDGGDLAVLMESSNPLYDAGWSPSGSTILALSLEEGPHWQPVLHRVGDPADRLQRLPAPPNGQPWETLRWARSEDVLVGSTTDGSYWSWSIAEGQFRPLDKARAPAGLSLHSVLADGRLLLGGAISSDCCQFALLDPRSGSWRILATIDTVAVVAVQPDERALWFLRLIEEADLWIAREGAESK